MRALIVMDMQRDLCWDERRRAEIDDMVPALQAIIECFRVAGETVVYTRFALAPDDPQFERFGDVYCVEGTEGAELIPEMEPLAGPVITKNKHSAFFETGLDDILVAAGVTEVYLAGLQTQICVLTTAADASFRDYRAVVLEDCVVSSREEVKLDALEWIRRYVGEVAASTEVATWLHA